MSRLSLKRKLPRAHKAWKIINRAFLSQINEMKNSTFVRQMISRTILAVRSFRPSLPFGGRRTLVPRTCYPSSSHHDSYNGYSHQHQKNYAPIYIDKLFGGHDQANKKTCSSAMSTQGKSSGRNKVELDKGKRDEGGDERSYDIDERWRAIVAKCPQLRCVDERAAEFIDSFKEEMKLERERSILEFQEMLRRGV